MPLPTQARLNQHLVRWDSEIKAFDAVISEYGQKKADLEYRRAVVMENAKSSDEKLSQAAAERVADADQEAYRLHREYRAAESSIEAKKARLRWCAAVADALRSEVSTERAEAKLYADTTD
ncbi:chromosome segregation ATPase [Microbacterium resistens]|uniref:Chromosome segregation ATPase n=1 Tax=Microbacterium resistens TaxID=156977 RepID=A0ABU1SFK0_9MICO|nr:hypothetical protein [Microbacterium resistens]MDR6867652.1 chromosome segregation ATPase [Microbacterium resistens]